MTKRRALAVALAAASMVAVAMPATSSAANPWTTPANQFLNMAHQGGELEAPGNTLYAFKTALKDRGADCRRGHDIIAGVKPVLQDVSVVVQL